MFSDISIESPLLACQFRVLTYTSTDHERATTAIGVILIKWYPSPPNNVNDICSGRGRSLKSN